MKVDISEMVCQSYKWHVCWKQFVSLVLSSLISFKSLLLSPVGNDPLQTSVPRIILHQLFHYPFIYPREKKRGGENDEGR